MDKISELPQDILQRILYWLSQEDAVRTSVLSKSWRNIWCTRHNLHFSDAAFKGDMHQFLSIVNTTLQLYRDQGLCVDEFHVCMSVFSFDCASVSLVEEWVRTLTSMCVKKFCLCNLPKLPSVELPSVVFGAESLQDLHLEGFVLDRKAIERIVPLKNLTSLILQRVSIEEGIFEKIISCCPFIEILDIRVCTMLRKIIVKNLHNLKYFSFSDDVDHSHSFEEELCMVEIHTPSPETIYISEGNVWFHKGPDFFRNLKHLRLCLVKSSLEHLWSCKFPSLDSLILANCDGLKGIEVFIDAPNVTYFGYHGDFIPSISFSNTTSREWISDIDLTYDLSGDASWFIKLHELLKSLSQSEISLYFNCYYLYAEIRENINLEPASVVVETLQFSCLPSSMISCLLNGVFSICRPRNIEEDPYGDKWERKRMERLWKILTERNITEEGRCSRGLWFQDLEEVRMEIYDDNRKEWSPTTLSELPTYNDHNRKERQEMSLMELPDYREYNPNDQWHPICLSRLRNENRRESIRFALKWIQD
ncbi:PREDICTED: putative F-box/LRR-repeat protein At4g15060 [Erythranthe guttata]|uniref:putative F-box/LRR-repeat protein At4g15060 n=1 Tax=Erythranthe guttata TaxID=4155 RepID=UPI00064DCE9E|nr:PREDICTED: putative F-box/LRR-repeat protein At4g15060 [Erythranthe guttata]|eukprot:XP_012857546.1 PREDICTED: putative F-box/LRR-repeat protein At4g15060 [Erythranthe guttata]